jgi:hypothetical protein
MGEWLAEYKEYVIAVGGLIQLVVGAFVVRWLTVEIDLVKKTADERYEPKRAQRTAEEDQLRIDSLARRILSGPIIKEFSDNTVLAAYERPEFRRAVETTVDISLPIQNRIDARIEHKAIDENLKQDIRFEKFRNEVGAEIRHAVSGSQTAIFEKIDLLFDKIGELQSIQMQANK